MDIKNDLTGKVFENLKVLKRAPNAIRGKQSRVCWECECLLCGNIRPIYYDCLISGDYKACGCLKRDKDLPQELRNQFVEGTQISKIQSIPTKANKSGVVGVNWDKSRNKWQTSIRLNGKKYNIGRFVSFEDACMARKEAEEELFKRILDNYEDKGLSSIDDK